MHLQLSGRAMHLKPAVDQSVDRSSLFLHWVDIFYRAAEEILKKIHIYMPKRMNNPAGDGNAFDLPIELRANELTRRILNIDSRFRSNPTSTTSSNFYYRLLESCKNILRIRLTSVEFPTNVKLFTAKRQNVILRIIYDRANPTQYILHIPDGNYTPEQMVTTIQADLTANLTWLSVAYNAIEESFTFTGTQVFAVDTTYHSLPRLYTYGLGYYLGFTQKSHMATLVADKWTVSSDATADFVGDMYAFLRVNDYDCVRHQTSDQKLTAFAKLSLRGSGDYGYDDHTREVVFTNPQDISRLHIQLVDAYGDLLDIGDSTFSFSLEILEVKNTSLYNTIRDSLSIRYV